MSRLMPKTRRFFDESIQTRDTVVMDAPPYKAILLRLRGLTQLFNSMDPSPFVDRGLDAEAEEFITRWARELPAKRELKLVIHLALGAPADRIAGVEEAVRHYFERRAAIKRLEFTQKMRRGRLSMGVGLVFLAVCLLLGQFIARPGLGATADIIKEGLTIGAWVAMWKPLELCLYGWWPLLEERRLLERLARMRVECVGPSISSAEFIGAESDQCEVGAEAA